MSRRFLIWNGRSSTKGRDALHPLGIQFLIATSSAGSPPRPMACSRCARGRGGPARSITTGAVSACVDGDSP